MELHMLHTTPEQKIAVIGYLYKTGKPDAFLSKVTEGNTWKNFSLLYRSLNFKYCMYNLKILFITSVINISPIQVCWGMVNLFLFSSSVAQWYSVYDWSKNGKEHWDSWSQGDQVRWQEILQIHGLPHHPSLQARCYLDHKQKGNPSSLPPSLTSKSSDQLVFVFLG